MHQIDTFTIAPFRGNPSPVIIIPPLQFDYHSHPSGKTEEAEENKTGDTDTASTVVIPDTAITRLSWWMQVSCYRRYFMTLGL